VILTRREVHAGEIPPMGYAWAWHVPGRDASVFYPFPLNIPAAWGRAAWHFLKWNAGKRSVIDKAIDEAYSQGCKDQRDSMERHYEVALQDAYAVALQDAHALVMDALNQKETDGSGS